MYNIVVGSELALQLICIHGPWVGNIKGQYNINNLTKAVGKIHLQLCHIVSILSAKSSMSIFMLLFSEAGQTCLCQEQQNIFCEIMLIDPNSDFCYVPQSTAVSSTSQRMKLLRKMWTLNVRRENLVIKKTAAVYNRHFDSTDFIQGGQRRLKEAAVTVSGRGDNDQRMR